MANVKELLTDSGHSGSEGTKSLFSGDDELAQATRRWAIYKPQVATDVMKSYSKPPGVVSWRSQRPGTITCRPLANSPAWQAILIIATTCVTHTHTHIKGQKMAELIKVHYFKRYRTYIYTFIHKQAMTTGRVSLSPPPHLSSFTQPATAQFIHPDQSIPAPRYEFDIYTKHTEYTTIKKKKRLDKKGRQRHAVPARCRLSTASQVPIVGLGKDGGIIAEREKCPMLAALRRQDPCRSLSCVIFVQG